MADFRIEVEGAYKGRTFELEFGLDRKPRSLIALGIPERTEEVEIRPVKGRHFGDRNDDGTDGTPATIKVGHWTAPATYYERGNYGKVYIGEAT